jgi:glycosyltransferase involved in cell wall biosynthesis
MNKNKQKLAVIGTVGLPACYGGFETLAEQLVMQLGDEMDITVYCSKQGYVPEQRKSHWQTARLVWLPIKANGIGGIIYDAVSIFHALFYANTLLILGVPGAILLPFAKLFFPKKRIIVNIDGLEWSRQKWGRAAKFFLQYSEKVAVKWADEVVTDNAAIQKYALERYGKHTNLITYGGDQAKSVHLTPEVEEKYPFVLNRYAFTVCRIEPENNIEMLLQAFESADKIPLVVVGNWYNSEYGKHLKYKYTGSNNILLFDPIYDLKILNQLRSNAAIYMHGHSAGGTNPSLVEAMHLGVPIVAFDVIFNRVTTHHRAFYFGDKEELCTVLAFLDFDLFGESAKEMHEIAKQNYTWKSVARKYANLIYERQSQIIPVFDFEIPVPLRRKLQLA